MDTKWKVLGIVGVVIAILIMIITGFIWWFTYSIKNSLCDKYLDVPINISLSSSDIKITPISSYFGKPDIFVFTHEQTNKIPENCSINSLSFFLSVSKIRGEIEGITSGQSRPYPNSGARIKFPVSYNFIFEPRLFEPNNKKGEIKEALLSDKKFFIPIQIGFTESEQVHYDFYESLGCYSLFFPVESNLTLSGVGEQEITLKSEQNICIKKVGNFEGPNNNRLDNEGCTFFKATSDITINTDVLEDLTKEGEVCRPIF